MRPGIRRLPKDHATTLSKAFRERGPDSGKSLHFCEGALRSSRSGNFGPRGWVSGGLPFVSPSGANKSDFQSGGKSSGSIPFHMVRLRWPLVPLLAQNAHILPVLLDLFLC